MVRHPILVYVAGPFRAPTPWQVEQNIRRAEDVAVRVARAGAMPMVPHTMTRFWGDSCASDEFWLAGTMEMMRRCDGVVLVTGWYNSVGSQAEKAEADRLGIPWFDAELDGDEELRAWAATVKAWQK